MKPEKSDTSCCKKSSCCTSNQEGYKTLDVKGKYIAGWLDTKTEVGKVPKVSTTLSKSDKWGMIKTRLAIKRMEYKIQPGLYAVGEPDALSTVLVTANYKLTFDVLRRELTGINAWILVLDTKGINVWCAAGKGTFSTAELVNRVEITGLKHLAKHRKLVVPQLGAVGISAHNVRKRSGFSVIYGPVRAADLPVFLKKGMKAEPEMRRVRFSMFDRLKVAPVEMVQGFRYLLIIGAIFFLLSGLSGSGYSIHWQVGAMAVLNILLAYLAGTLIGPLLLPWLPGRSFSSKGAVIGVVTFLILFFIKWIEGGYIQVAAWLFLIPAISSFLTMNFTGASTYTSLSGVKKEMRFAVPLQIIVGVTGFSLWMIARFV